MLINAQRPEQLRVAIVDDGTLDEYEVAAAEHGLRRGNIYRGVVAHTNPSLNAAFVEFGAERHGLLKAEDVVPSLLRKGVDRDRRPRVEKILDKGQSILVQVTRDAIHTKGAKLTTNLSLAGRYLVLMPLDNTRGISRKVEDEASRARLKERLGQLNLPEGCGVIIRTNAADQPKAALNRDVNALLRLWKRVRDEASHGKGPRLLYSDQDLIVQALRDYLDSSIQEVLIDDDQAYARARAYMRTFMPRGKTRLVHYSDRMPLFSRYDLEPQIDSIYQRRVELPGGGSIVIEGTEALTTTDVNSGRARGSASQEENSFAINLEAAAQVARQLRLRDIGGLIVVDFIDMRSRKHQRELERAMRDAMKADKARSTVGRLSPNGLLEINRQRIRQELQLQTHRECPTCSGAGTIPSSELVGLNLMRRVETRAVTGSLAAVRIGLHPELADAIQNHRRHEIAALESEFGIRVEINALTSLHRSEERVEWVKREQGDRPRREEVAAVSAADVAPPEGRPEGQSAKAAGKNSHSGDEEKEGPRTARPRRRRRGGRRRKKASQTSGNDSGQSAS